VYRGMFNICPHHFVTTVRSQRIFTNFHPTVLQNFHTAIYETAYIYIVMFGVLYCVNPNHSQTHGIYVAGMYIHKFIGSQLHIAYYIMYFSVSQVVLKVYIYT
jgi:hypothetical protein